MRKTILIISTSLILLVLSTLTFFIYLSPSHHLSPLSFSSEFSLPTAEPPHQLTTTLGFLPFWNLDRLNPTELDSLTDLAYFGVELNPDGSIRTHSSPTSQEPGWHRLTTGIYPTLKAQTATALRHHLVIRIMDTETIEAVLNSPTHQKTAISEILRLTNTYQFAGVNLDFETTTTPHPATTGQLTQFIATLRQTINNQQPQLVLSIDTYANAAAKRRLWDLPRLAPYLDYFIIMGYDFHRSTSLSTGAVAPLLGSWDCDPQPHQPCTYSYDLTSTLNDYLKLVDNRQLVLALPLYGYEWQTSSPLPRAATIPQTGSLASLRRIGQLIKTKCGLIHLRKCPQFISQAEITTDLDRTTLFQTWDPEAHSPLLIYYDDTDEAWHQIYYENQSSIKYKLQLAAELNLRGIAYWALGYR